MSDFVIHVVTLSCLYGMLALSLNLQAGFGGLVNFGQVALFGCGTYGAGLAFFHGLGWYSGLVIGICLALCVGLAFARMGRNLGADYWAIATLSIAEILRTFANNEDWLTGSAQGIAGLPLFFSGSSRLTQHIFILCLCAGCLLLAWLICHRVTTSRYGMSLKLMREEPNLARALGYDLIALKQHVMMIGGAIAAASGFLFAHYVTFVGPDQLVASETFLIWAMIIIGGFGNHLGAIAGAFFLQFLLAFVPFAKDVLQLPSDYAAAIRLTLVGGGLVLFLLWRTQGLVPERVGGSKHV